MTKVAGDRRSIAERDTETRAPLRIAMLGAPGAGKGTQADRFAKARGVPRISTGDILRQAVQEKTELGRAVRSTMEAGRLVSDDLVVGIVRERLRQPDTEPGFVLDGFPRNIAQAEALDTLVDGRAPLIVLDIEVPEETLIDRLQSRRVCRNCGTPATASQAECSKCGGPLVQRRDDNRDVVIERLRIYERDTRPLIEFYRGRATFRSVDGDQPLAAVAADIAAAVASVIGARA